MSINILIADDHSMIREGLKQLIELDPDFFVVGQAANGLEAIEKVNNLKPDVLLLDINMPKMNGLETLEELRKTGNDVKIIMLTIHNEVEYLIKAIDTGCNGYILKDSDSTVLKKAIMTVYGGDSYIQPAIIPKLNVGLTQKSKSMDKLSSLTQRELEVLKLIAEGMFNKEIAAKLNISERTVKNHISNIFKKIEVSDRTQAAVFAIRNDVIKLV